MVLFQAASGFDEGFNGNGSLQGIMIEQNGVVDLSQQLLSGRGVLKSCKPLALRN